MSKVPLYTGGGTDDPDTISQFKQARSYSTATGITEITSSTNSLQVQNPNGPTVNLVYNGVDSVIADDGISATPMGTAVSIKNTGVRTLTSTTDALTITSVNSGDPAGTGDLRITFNPSGGGGGGGSNVTIPTEAFCIMMQTNSGYLTQWTSTAQFYPFVQNETIGTPLWDFTVPTGTSSLIGPTFAFNGLINGTIDLDNSGRFTSGLKGFYIFTYTGLASTTQNAGFPPKPLKVPLCLVKNGNTALLGTDCGDSEVSTRIIFLDVGDYVELQYYNDQVDAPTLFRVLHDTFNLNMPNESTPQPKTPIFFSGARLTGSSVATGSDAGPERFAVTLDTNAVVGTDDNAWTPIGNLTPVLDTVAFPTYHPTALFNNLTAGSLNMSTGVFTVGVTGYYILTSTASFPSGVATTKVAFRVNGSKILTPHTISSPSTEGTPFVSFQYLEAGDQVELVVWNNAGTLPKSLTDTITSETVPHIIWSGYIVRSGAGGGGGTASSESFQAALSTDFGWSTTGYAPLFETTTVVDTATFPTVAPEYLFNKLTLGTYDGTTSTFTVGVSGVYQFTCENKASIVGGVDQIVFRLDDSKYLIPFSSGDLSRFSILADLTVGQTVQLYAHLTGSGLLNYFSTSASGDTVYTVTWGGCLIQPGTGTNTTTIIGADAESFSIAMNADLVVNATANVPFQVVDWTDTVNVGTYPEVSPAYLYRQLSTSTISLATGTFTAGSNGQYQFSVQHPRLDGDVDDATIMLKVGSKYVPLRNAANDNIFSANLNLTQGDAVEVWAAVGASATVTFARSLTNADSDIVKPALVFSGQRLNATVAIGGADESFSVTLSTPHAITPNVWEDVGNWTATLDTVEFTDYDPNAVFSRLSYGSLNLTTGEFTVGITGRYLITMTVRVIDTGVNRALLGIKRAGKVIRGANNNGGNDSWSFLIDLASGDVIRPVSYSAFGGALPVSYTDFITPLPIPGIIWGCSLILATSGGSGSGVVETIVPGDAYITVDSTDPANPVIGNNGVHTVSSSHAYLTVNNADPNNPVLTNNGVLTLATTGAQSGLELTGTANNPILRNTGIRSITSSTPGTLTVINNNGAVTLSATGGGGGGGGSGTVVGVSAAVASGAEVPNVGLTIANPTSNVTIQNNAVLRVTGGTGISITGDQRNRTIAIGNIGSGPNYTSFNPSTGFQSMAGSARPWKVETVPMIYYSTTDSTLAPGGNEIYAGARSWFPSFRNAANINSLTGFWPVPYELAWTNIGVGQYATNTYFGINWTPNTTAAGNVRWRLRWRYLRAGDVLAAGTPFVTDGVTQSAGGVVGSLRWTGFFAVNQVLSGLPNTGQGDVIAVSVQRDPDDPLDTYPDQALFMGLRICYQIDQLGGRQNTAR